ncbi:hypothetical protein [Tardiphaga sp. 839_C3_N1_4]|uniref:hypothetical protein n=1 Tax=Tardiphaga sp. 839_C3_N1_4 TaxID=3240761 RepID=UPI003F294945
MTIRDSYTYDNLTLLKDAGAITADGAATVGGQARFLDLGDAMTEGHFIVDTSAIDLTSADETYRVILQGSNTTNFAATVELASLVVSAAGRAAAPFQTRIGSTNYRYVRAYTDVGGTTPSLNFTAFLGK